jgi:putative salt-induced outer membrane protein YdiY
MASLSRYARPPVLVLIALAVCVAPAHAAKTDVVVMRNGDTITGEIDVLERGRLRFKTDDMGTLDIEWDKVRHVSAGATFEIEDLAGGRYFGSLQPGAQEGELEVVGLLGVQRLELTRIVVVRRLGATFWRRLDGSIDVGASYTSSSELLKIDLSARAKFRRPGYELSADANATITRQPEVENTRRSGVTLAYTRRRENRWLGFGQGKLEQNRELGFDLRAALAGGGGRILVQSPRDDLLTALGVSLNRERPVEGDTTTNTELMLVLRYDRFSYDFPKVDVLVTLAGFASLNDWGRTRVELDASLKRELFKDFSASLKAYESYDSRPASAGAPKNDYGLTFALGWSF